MKSQMMNRHDVRTLHMDDVYISSFDQFITFAISNHFFATSKQPYHQLSFDNIIKLKLSIINLLLKY